MTNSKHADSIAYLVKRVANAKDAEEAGRYAPAIAALSTATDPDGVQPPGAGYDGEGGSFPKLPPDDRLKQCTTNFREGSATLNAELKGIEAQLASASITASEKASLTAQKADVLKAIAGLLPAYTQCMRGANLQPV